MVRSSEPDLTLEIVTVGDELLHGFTIDTNSAHIAREVAAFGFRVTRRAAVGDTVPDIAAAIRDALSRTGAVITTGGLGPTADDLTIEAVAEVFACPLELDTNVLNSLHERWKRRFGVEMPESNRKQAMIPRGATVLVNNHGSAPGVFLENDAGQWVIVLPGVPREMRGMMQDTVVPLLNQRFGRSTVVRSITIRTTGIAESALADRLGELSKRVNGMSVAYLPGRDGVDLRITSSGLPAKETESTLRAAADLLRERVGKYVYGENDDDLATLVLARCRSQQLTIAVAESCTGGLLGGRITSVPGSSENFIGGVIAYDNSVKVRELGVSENDLEQHGAVSELVARGMASGVRTRFGTSIGVGITGVAGPGGGSKTKPVGTVWVAVDYSGQVHAVRAILPGDREEIRYRAAQLALDRVRRALDRDTSLPGWAVRG